MDKQMEKYVLAPYISCGFCKDELDIGFGSILITITDKSDQSAYLKAALFMKTPRTLSELENFIMCETISSNKSSVYENFLLKNFLIREENYNLENRYSRNYFFYNLSGSDPAIVQEKLEKKHVIVLGCGGIGNIVAINLATSGIGKLTLVDNDCIELSNLTRQILFCENDTGNKKASTLKEALLSRNKNVTINTLDILCDSYDKIKNLPSCDLIVASGDSSNICHYLNKHSFSSNTPFINVGYIQDVACWGPFIIPGKTACYECFSAHNIANQENELKSMVEKINFDYKAPSFGAINMLAAASATLDVIKFLGGIGSVQSLNKRIGIWTDNLKIEYQDYQKRTDCTLCAS